MRATSWSWWVLLLAALAFAVGSAGCGKDQLGRGFPSTDPIGEPGPDDEPPIDVSGSGDECPGQCVAQPQAPFNARIHLMWFGPESISHECPPDAPLPGLVAQVLSMDMAGQPENAREEWVRECLISNDDDPCDQGETCALAPPDDYELCISREIDGPCPTEYYPRHVVAQEPGEPPAWPLTLCCTSARRVP